MTTLHRQQPADIFLHEIEIERRDYTVRIGIPGHDIDRPEREISAGWFQGNPRGILIRVTDLPDLRTIANVLLEAADKLEANTDV